MFKKKNLEARRVAKWALQFKEYLFQTVHKPGELMLHVDALNRNPTQATLTCRVVIASIHNWKQGVHKADMEINDEKY